MSHLLPDPTARSTPRSTARDAPRCRPAQFGRPADPDRVHTGTAGSRSRNEQLEEFRSVPSHDLRNSVTVAKGYEVAREGDDPAALDRIDAILNDVL